MIQHKLVLKSVTGGARLGGNLSTALTIIRIEPQTAQ